MDKLKNLRKNIIVGNAGKAASICRELIEEKVPPQTIIKEAMVPAMSDLSSSYDSEKLFIPQLLLSSKALNECLKALRTVSGAEQKKNAQIKIVLGTIKGDIHSIGKNIVSYFLRTYGYTIIDLGINVSGEQFVKAVHEHGAQCVVISSMLTSTLVHVKDAVKTINQEDFGYKPCVIVGGALMTEGFAREIGAEYGFSAVDTANIIKDRFGTSHEIL